MKFFVVALALVAVVNGLPQGAQERNAQIVRQSSDASPEGSYSHNYETENGIQAAETGSLQRVGANGEEAVVAQGNYQYTAPDGQVIAITYTADQNGYQPIGDAIPVAPAIPEQIQRALAYIAAHPPKPENRK